MKQPRQVPRIGPVPWTRRELLRNLLAGAVASEALLPLQACGGGSQGGNPGGGGGAQPQISYLSPSYIMTTVPQQQTFNVFGSNFESSSIVTINQSLVATTFVSETHLQATPSGGQMSSLGTYEIEVVNGSSVSNAVSFVMAPPVQGPQPFNALSAYLIGGQVPGSIAMADVNGDGLKDVILVGPTGSIAVLKGQSDGTLSAPEFVQNAPAFSVAAGDVNGDGVNDIIAAAFPAVGDSTGSKSSIEVLLNDGKGNFNPGQTLVFNGTYPTQMVLADFLGSGRNDLIAAIDLDTNSAIYLFANQGGGNFGAPTILTTVAGSLSIAVADFNGDGKPDIAYASSIEVPGTHLLLNQGGGVFNDVVPSALASVFGNLVSGDFNGDGLPDLAIESTSESAPITLQVFLNLGNNSFQSASLLTIAYAGNNPPPLVVGDFDHDGIVDIASIGNVSAGPSSMLFLWGDGTGDFTTQNIIGPVGFSAAAGDVNGDGIPDIVVPDIYMENATVVLGSSTRTFFQPSYLLPAVASDISVGDVDGDGFPDLFFAGDTFYQIPGSVFLNQRNGTFALAGRPSYWGVSLIDLNGDGKAELFGSQGDTFMIWLGTGDPNFGSSPIMIPAPAGAGSVGGMLFADLNGDGLAEIVGPNFIGWNQGSLQFEFQLYGFNAVFAIGDVNGDGVPDLITDAGTFLNQGNRQFAQIANNGLLITSGALVALGYFSGDEKLDAALITPFQTGGAMRVYYGRGDGTFYLQSVVNGTMTFAGSSNLVGLVVADFNGDGLADIMTPLEGAPEMLLYTNNGSGQFETSYFSPGVSCAAIANADFNKNGKQDIAIVGANGAVVVLVYPK